MLMNNLLFGNLMDDAGKNKSLHHPRFTAFQYRILMLAGCIITLFAFWLTTDDESGLWLIPFLALILIVLAGCLIWKYRGFRATHIEITLALGRCPACDFPLGGSGDEALSRCTECGALWRPREVSAARTPGSSPDIELIGMGALTAGVVLPGLFSGMWKEGLLLTVPVLCLIAFRVWQRRRLSERDSRAP